MSLAQQLADLSNPAPEIDPESVHFDLNSISDDELARDHYSIPTTSALRSAVPLELDEMYQGKKVSRKDLNDSVSGSEEVSGDEVEGQEQEESDLEEDSEDFHSNEEYEQEDFDSDSQHSQSDYEEESQNKTITTPLDIASQIAHLEKDNKKMIKSLADTAQADVEKGLHVKNQVALWDGLLDLRIRMQKSVELANSMPQLELYQEILDIECKDAVDATSTVLFGLLNQLVDARIVKHI